MGFGHRVYKNYDPRAKIIKRWPNQVFEVTGRNPLLDIALELERIALQDDYFVTRKLYPNVDFYSGHHLRGDGVSRPTSSRCSSRSRARRAGSRSGRRCWRTRSRRSRAPGRSIWAKASAPSFRWKSANSRLGAFPGRLGGNSASRGDLLPGPTRRGPPALSTCRAVSSRSIPEDGSARPDRSSSRGLKPRPGDCGRYRDLPGPTRRADDPGGGPGEIGGRPRRGRPRGHDHHLGRRRGHARGPGRRLGARARDGPPRLPLDARPGLDRGGPRDLCRAARRAAAPGSRRPTTSGSGWSGACRAGQQALDARRARRRAVLGRDVLGRSALLLRRGRRDPPEDGRQEVPRRRPARDRARGRQRHGVLEPREGARHGRRRGRRAGPARSSTRAWRRRRRPTISTPSSVPSASAGSKDGVSYDDSAPLSSIRRGITTGSSLSSSESGREILSDWFARVETKSRRFRDLTPLFDGEVELVEGRGGGGAPATARPWTETPSRRTGFLPASVFSSSAAARAAISSAEQVAGWRDWLRVIVRKSA